MLITTLVVSFLVSCMLEVRCGQAGAVSGLQTTGCRLQGACSLQPRHYYSIPAPNLQPTGNQERNDQCGNQHYSRELLMLGIVVPETFGAYKKYNKIISSIQLVFYSSAFVKNQATSSPKPAVSTCSTTSYCKREKAQPEISSLRKPHVSFQIKVPPLQVSPAQS